MIDIRGATDGDKDRILALMEVVLGPAEATRAERRWHWQWQQDPRLAQPGYQGVVAVWKDRLIASLSCIPAGLYIRTKPICACWSVDNLVHWGLARNALHNARRNGGNTRESGLDNRIALAMLDHPVAGRIQLAKHVTGKVTTLGSRVGYRALNDTGRWSRQLSAVGPLRRSLGRPLGFLVGAAADLALPRPPPPKLEAIPFEGDFDERFERLWTQALEEYPAITRRDPVTLNWRYRQHPDTRYTTLVLEEKDQIRGYLIYSRLAKSDRLHGTIVDLLVRRGDTEAVQSLLATALRRLRRARAERVDYFAVGALLKPVLQDLGFRSSTNVYPVWERGLPHVELYATDGDGDGA